MESNESIPAFPRPGYELNAGDGSVMQINGHPGMSLRDWFAGKVLQGTLASPHWYFPDGNLRTKESAVFAFKMADAMLEERQR